MTKHAELIAQLEETTWPQGGNQECYNLEADVIKAFGPAEESYFGGSAMLRSLDAAVALAARLHHVLSWEMGDTIGGCFARVVTTEGEHKTYRHDSHAAAALVAALLKAGV